MAIDFHDRQNAGTYAGRKADAGWRRAISGIVDPAGLHVVDVGCGGGIYSTALAQMGAAHVTGVDFSAPMVRDARQQAADSGVTTVTFRQGTAERTGLPEAAAQAVLHRALIHHLAEPVAAFVEARRLLAPEGTLLVQDRTMEDVLAPPSAQHLRGWFFELCPRLAAVEAARRPEPGAVEDWLRQAGFATVRRHRLTERRRRYADVGELRADLRARTGRSILHELDDGELEWLADRICARIAETVPPGEPVDEVDHWSVWEAR